MIFHPTPLEGSYVVELTPFGDERGWFARWYCKDEFAAIGHSKEWVQMNHSYTRQKGAVRGMHYQVPPYREIKLVRCIAGRVFDVIVDVRNGSPSFLQYAAVELSAENKRMLYIPEGFAHGFQVLEDESELIYLHTELYRPGAEGGIRYDDPVVGIDWPLGVTMLSDRDAGHPFISDNFNGI
ncbi:MAG TPA: dTDP-4-dehydrorhamnose 3,5-epimerase [Puia sp.]|nr:dTDP-4-dehydrorhamnose 3,5-epimerase [Puia sp.]